MPKRSQVNPGDRFNCFVILDELQRTKYDRVFRVQCDCGNTHDLPLKTIRRSKYCPDDLSWRVRGSAVERLLSRYPFVKRVKKSKIYELWVWLRRNHDAPVCDRWRDDILDFLDDFTELMGGEAIEYVQPRRSWVYYTMERIDKDGIWEKSNVTVRRFYTERAFHRPTYLYWRLLGHRGLLEQPLKDSYTEFITTFGHKQVGYVLRRRDARRLHRGDNSFWYPYRKSLRVTTGPPDSGTNATGTGSGGT